MSRTAALSSHVCSCRSLCRHTINTRACTYTEVILIPTHTYCAHSSNTQHTQKHINPWKQVMKTWTGSQQIRRHSRAQTNHNQTCQHTHACLYTNHSRTQQSNACNNMHRAAKQLRVTCVSITFTRITGQGSKAYCMRGRPATDHNAPAIGDPLPLHCSG